MEFKGTIDLGRPQTTATGEWQHGRCVSVISTTTDLAQSRNFCSSKLITSYESVVALFDNYEVQQCVL